MSNFFRIRSASGLGDAVYAYPVCKYYKEKGENVILETQFPEIFEPLGIATTTERLLDYELNCSYVPFKGDRNTNQFQDTLRAAKIDAEIPFKIELKKRHPDFRFVEPIWAAMGKAIPEVKVGTKKICIVADLYMASGIRHRETLIPNQLVYEAIIELLKAKGYLTVLTGQGQTVIQNTDVNIKNETDITNLLAFVNSADLVLTQVGALLPIAEALGKKCISILSANYRKSGDAFLNQITPRKVVSAPTSVCFQDDEGGMLAKIGEFV